MKRVLIVSVLILALVWASACTQATFAPISSNHSASDSTCTGTLLADLYNSSVTTHTVTQDDIAQDCVDQVTPYSANISFSPTNIPFLTRYQTTCATRFCRLNFNDVGAVGILRSNVQWLPGNTQIDTAAPAVVECHHNDLAILNTSGFCQVQINQAKPLEVFALTYGDSKCGYCGCDSNTVLNRWATGAQSLVSCGTAYCQSLGAGFNSGILSEANANNYIIACSRADIAF